MSERDDRDTIAAVIGVFFVLLVVTLVMVMVCVTRSGPAERPQVKTEVPTTETVCVEATETYCKRYETRRILRE